MSDLESDDPSPQHLPLARVKRVIKLDKGVKNVSSEAVAVIAKAAEMFLAHLAEQAYASTKYDSRKVIQYKDLSACIKDSEELEFLEDVIPAQ